MEILYLITLLIAVLSNTLLIIYIALQTRETLSKISFMVLLALINIWAIPQIILLILNYSGETFVLIDKISALGYTMIPVAYFVFAFSFAKNTKSLVSYLTLTFIYVPAVIFLFFAWNTDFIESRNPAMIRPELWGYAIPTGPLFPALVIWFESTVLYSLYTIIRYHNHSSIESQRRQSQLIITASFIPLFFGTITNGILPALHIHTFPSAIPLTSIMAAIIAYAIIKYELFDFSSNFILSNIGNGIITVNQAGKIENINKSAIRLLRLNVNKTLGKKFSDIINLTSTSHIRHKKYLHPVNHVLSSARQFVDTNYSMSTVHKKQFPVEFTITPVIERNKAIGATIVFMDITREKEAEKSKNEFISIASHELKTPITAIKAFSQILEKNLRQSSDRKNIFLITKINLQIDKITRLITDLLNISKIEEGRLSLKKEFFDYDALIKQTIADFKYSPHKINKLGSANNKIYADKDKIAQVLINLINNAIKYSPQHKNINVKISGNRHNIITCIEDFGIGIPKNDIGKLFKRYYRSEISQEKNIGGFGLGLYISSEIIKKHKGKIWCESEAGKWSRFYFSLPVNHKI